MYGFGFGKIFQCRLKRNILKSAVDLVANTQEKTMKYLQFNITRFRQCSHSPMLCSTFTFSFFKRQDIFLSTDGNAKTCYISQKRSGIITPYQDFCLDETERIQKVQLLKIFFLRVEMLNVLTCYISQKRSGIIISCQDFCLDEPERIQNNFLIFSRLRVKILNVLCILEALRHNNIMPGLLPG